MSCSPAKNRRSLAAIPTLVSLLFICSSQLSADLTIDFESAATAALFENDGVGDTAGPFLIDGIPVTFTTVSVSGFVDTSSFGLGVNSGGADPDSESFNLAEIWEMQADAGLWFMGLELGGLQSEESFLIQSDAWINLNSITPGSGVTYFASTGTFSLTDGPADDAFTISELTGGSGLLLPTGSTIVFGNLTSTFGPNDDVELQNFTFQSVPEPGTGLLLLLGICGASLIRRKT